eukprot:XP_024997589.1 basic proline-rich protein-like [Gallus gallus]
MSTSLEARLSPGQGGSGSNPAASAAHRRAAALLFPAASRVLRRPYGSSPGTRSRDELGRLQVSARSLRSGRSPRLGRRISQFLPPHPSEPRYCRARESPAPEIPLSAEPPAPWRRPSELLPPARDSEQPPEVRFGSELCPVRSQPRARQENDSLLPRLSGVAPSGGADCRPPGCCGAGSVLRAGHRDPAALPDSTAPPREREKHGRRDGAVAFPSTSGRTEKAAAGIKRQCHHSLHLHLPIPAPRGEHAGGSGRPRTEREGGSLSPGYRGRGQPNGGVSPDEELPRAPSDRNLPGAAAVLKDSGGPTARRGGVNLRPNPVRRPPARPGAASELEETAVADGAHPRGFRTELRRFPARPRRRGEFQVFSIGGTVLLKIAAVAAQPAALRPPPGTETPPRARARQHGAGGLGWQSPGEPLPTCPRRLPPGRAPSTTRPYSGCRRRGLSGGTRRAQPEPRPSGNAGPPLPPPPPHSAVPRQPRSHEWNGPAAPPAPPLRPWGRDRRQPPPPQPPTPGPVPPDGRPLAAPSAPRCPSAAVRVASGNGSAVLRWHRRRSAGGRRETRRTPRTAGPRGRARAGKPLSETETGAPRRTGGFSSPRLRAAPRTTCRAGEARAGGSVRTPGSAPAAPRAPDRPLAAYRGHRGARPPGRAVPPLPRRPPHPPPPAGFSGLRRAAIFCSCGCTGAQPGGAGERRHIPGVPAPRCRFRNGRPELRRVPPGPGGLRRGAGRDNPTLSPPFCYRAGVFPKQTQSGSLGNGPPLCRGGRCPQPGPGPPSPRGPAPVRTRPGTPGGSELLPTGIPAPLGALCAQRSRVAAVGPTRDTVAPGRHRLLSRCPQARNPERGRPSPPGAPGSRSCSLLSAHATSSEVTRRRCGPSRRATAGGAAPGSGHSARRLCPVPARPPLAPDPAPGSPLGWRRAALGPREAGRPEGFRSHWPRGGARPDRDFWYRDAAPGIGAGRAGRAAPTGRDGTVRAAPCPCVGVTERRWLTAPVGTGTAGRDLSPSPRQCPRVGDGSVTHARRRRGKLPGASGPTRARSALPELRGGGGRRRARGRRGLLQCCNAALRRELSPRPGALRRCCNAGASAAPGGRAEPSRAEPGHAVQAPPGRPPLAPPRASALPGIVAPVSFFSRPCRVRGTCPPAVGHRQPPSPRPSIRPVPVAVGAHLNPPAGPQSALIALSPPASRRGSPRRRDHRAAPGTARLGQHSGLGSDPLRCLLGSTVPAKLPSPKVTFDNQKNLTQNTNDFFPLVAERAQNCSEGSDL